MRRITDAVIEQMLELISWPTGSRVKEVIGGFKEYKGMDNVIGAIDGTHIPIIGQKKHNENYINRKGFSSIILQAVCDHTMRFTDCFVSYPGSVDDARVFDNSDLHQRISDDALNMFPGDTFIVGDAAYKLETLMMTPYKDCGDLTRDQDRYNYVQSASRTVIERTFGVMKKRFPRLSQSIEMFNLAMITKFILAVCIIHNYRISEDIRLGKPLIDLDDLGFETEVEEINNYVCYGSASRDAERKLDRIVRNL